MLNSNNYKASVQEQPVMPSFQRDFLPHCIIDVYNAKSIFAIRQERYSSLEA